MNAYSSFYFKPAKGEHIQTVVHIQPESRCALQGRLLDSGDRPVEAALALLYRIDGDQAPKLQAQCFTDEMGQFTFGPLQPDTLFLIRIYKDAIKLRELELRTD